MFEEAILASKLPERILLGPGPSNVPERVRRAMSRPLLGHLDPLFLETMNEIQQNLRRLFLCDYSLTIPVSGTGSAGMEASVVNFVEPGDRVLVGVHGVFGERIAQSVERCGGICSRVRAPFGEPLKEGALAEEAERCRPKVIAVVHAETSTGVLQPLEPIRELADRYEALLLVDAVTSLGGHPVRVGDWGLDVCYSGTQKCLSCPPGLAPLTVSPRAQERLLRRRSKVPSWYLDLSLVQQYWGQERAYHHTAPISMNFALQEALRIILEEGLERRWSRHRLNHQALVAGVEALGLQMHVAPSHRLWSLNTIRVPANIDDARVRRLLLEQYDVEIGGGLGPLQGKVWRVGLMGENSRPDRVLLFLHALGRILQREGYRCDPASGVAAAASCYADSKEEIRSPV